MSKFDEKVALYKKFMDDRDFRSNSDLLAAVTKGLGPSIYKADAETVSGSDAKELATVKKNYLNTICNVMLYHCLQPYTKLQDL